MEGPFPGGRSLVLQALQLREVPNSSIKICMSSITNSTMKQYNVGLKLWWTFCQSKKISVPLLLEFLTFHFERGASYGSLNCYRSAVAQLASPELANDYRLKRFFKGVYGLRPNTPRYDTTWDPSIVLSYVKNLPQSINLETLTHKLAILLALTTGQRVQTLANIQIENIIKTQDNLLIKIPKRIKTSGPNKCQPLLTLPFFKQDPRICVASTILQYLDRTKDLRNDSLNNLFITLKKPYRNASSQSISRWVKHMLDKSGIDISLFKAHSTRHAATSAAARNGVSFDAIRLSAGWSEKSKTFANFYQRPLSTNQSFAQTILSC